MQSPSANIVTLYGPLGLSALVIIGLFALAGLRIIDFTTAMGIIGIVLAGWGVNGLVTKQSLAAIQGSAMASTRRPVYVPRRASLQPEEDEHA